MGRRTSARGGGGAAWPSTASALVAGDGSSVTVGSGLSLSGGTLASAVGTRNPLNATTIAAYYMNETSGTTLANAVTSGTPLPSMTLYNNTDGNSNYTINDQGLYRAGTPAVRFNNSGAGSAAACAYYNYSLGTAPTFTEVNACTLEAVLSWDPMPTTGPVYPVYMVLCVFSYPFTSSAAALYFARLDPTTLRFGTANNATGITPIDITVPNAIGRIHVAATHGTGTVPWVVWINGKIAAQSTTSVPLRINALAGLGVGGNFSGLVGSSAVPNGATCMVSDVRFSTAALPYTYMQAATKAMGGL